MTGPDVHALLDRLLPAEQRRLWVAGEWRDAEGGDTFEVVDPADGQLLARVADGSVTDAVEALDAAVAAQADWAATAPRERGEILRSAFELIASRADDLATLMSLELGKAVATLRELLHHVRLRRLVIHGVHRRREAEPSAVLKIRISEEIRRVAAGRWRGSVQHRAGEPAH